MKQNRLNLYLIDIKYIRDLAKVDDKVMSVSPQISKEKRPSVNSDVRSSIKEYYFFINPAPAFHALPTCSPDT